MGLYKRGRYWHYDFRFEGIRYQGSTKQRDRREAGKIGRALKGDLARGKYGFPREKRALR